jgi:hypothetical protein
MEPAKVDMTGYQKEIARKSEFKPAGSPADKSFSAVVVPENEDAYLIHTNSATALATALKELRGQSVQVFPYEGASWAISTGPTQRYLLSPDGNRYPLFDSEDHFAVDPSGSMSMVNRAVANLTRGR